MWNSVLFSLHVCTSYIQWATKLPLFSCDEIDADLKFKAQYPSLVKWQRSINLWLFLPMTFQITANKMDHRVMQKEATHFIQEWSQPPLHPLDFLLLHVKPKNEQYDRNVMVTITFDQRQEELVSEVKPHKGNQVVYICVHVWRMEKKSVINCWFSITTFYGVRLCSSAGTTSLHLAERERMWMRVLPALLGWFALAGTCGWGLHMLVLPYQLWPSSHTSMARWSPKLPWSAHTTVEGRFTQIHPSWVNSSGITELFIFGPPFLRDQKSLDKLTTKLNSHFKYLAANPL